MHVIQLGRQQRHAIAVGGGHDVLDQFDVHGDRVFIDGFLQFSFAHVRRRGIFAFPPTLGRRPHSFLARVFHFDVRSFFPGVVHQIGQIQPQTTSFFHDQGRGTVAQRFKLCSLGCRRG